MRICGIFRLHSIEHRTLHHYFRFGCIGPGPGLPTRRVDPRDRWPFIFERLGDVYFRRRQASSYSLLCSMGVREGLLAFARHP